MEKSKKRHPVEIRFSPFSLLCLLFCWIGVSGLAFYVGILVGRTDQMREIRRIYSAGERAVAEEAFPPLAFEESLMLPEDEAALPPPTASKTVRPEPLPLAPPVPGAGIEGRVLQIASFRKAELAERLVRELRAKGYRCFHNTTAPSGSGESYWRVFVGPLPSAEMARQVKDRLEREEGYRGILIRPAEQKETTF